MKKIYVFLVIFLVSLPESKAQTYNQYLYESDFGIPPELKKVDTVNTILVNCGDEVLRSESLISVKSWKSLDKMFQNYFPRIKDHKAVVSISLKTAFAKDSASNSLLVVSADRTCYFRLRAYNNIVYSLKFYYVRASKPFDSTGSERSLFTDGPSKKESVAQNMVENLITWVTRVGAVEKR